MPEFMSDELYHTDRDGWWTRALDGELSPAEQRAWEAHLAICASCRLEWEALRDIDRLFAATPPPAPPADFVAKTVAAVEKVSRRRWLARLLGGVFIVSIILLAEILAFNMIFSDITQAGGALLASRSLLFQTLMRIWVSLIALGDMLLPLALGMLSVSLLLLMPNGILATLTFLLLRRQRNKAWGRA